MSDLASAVADFLAQPLGAIGAFCIMSAVTVINSQWLRDRLGLSEAGIGALFNGLNLVGGVCLFVNAMIRDEIVWLVLETYFVLIAVKGIVQASRAVAGPTEEERHDVGVAAG